MWNTVVVWLAMLTYSPNDSGAGALPTKFLLEIAADASIELEAFWEPGQDGLYGLFKKNETLRSVNPAEVKRVVSSDRFVPLLPKQEVSVGSIWKVSSAAMLTLLDQFHSGVTDRLRHSGSRPGAYACLRAVNDDAVAIQLRAHVDFDLGDKVRYSPAQFEGHLVLNREDGSIQSFHLFLPDRNTNVDVNVPFEYSPSPGAAPVETMAADIGWVRRMELVGGLPSSEPDWAESLTRNEVRSRLQRSFYEFAVIEWLPFEEAVHQARDNEKPLHLVLLFGSLDDESC